MKNTVPHWSDAAAETIISILKFIILPPVLILGSVYLLTDFIFVHLKVKKKHKQCSCHWCLNIKPHKLSEGEIRYLKSRDDTAKTVSAVIGFLLCIVISIIVLILI